eukprot:CAMPEP_0113567006 /NCGR_PEP_ID=MMETSP0015_2-20120614/23037_1 /TAXON_ID=2838 /ORGANISM="Odontella" /LENGTH=64 /DNA_ID=CAMNT_0000469355 /DNA_START=107 /DNA_END=301 /DNA_ORIENTATION=- /assembly_acc=CAM_ASM_000160
MPSIAKEEEPLTPAQMAINGAKLLFALSPLLVLLYVLVSGFETDEKESEKRNKKTDFALEGHGE